MQSTVRIGMLVFPDVLQLDLTGPYAVFAAGPGAKVDLVWKNTEPVKSCDGLILTPNVTMVACPQLDVLCVPGGLGILPLLTDEETLGFLRRQAQGARFVTSVCTGALVLGAAGLLQGFKATTHWSSFELLEDFGAIPTKRRVVVDENRVTAAGVTSGLDMALILAEKLWGLQAAQAMTLNMEYEPEPLYLCGSPETAPPDIVKNLLHKNAERRNARVAAAREAAKKLHETNPSQATK